jgi:DNA-binding GntR family transcriptional regulator
LAQLYDDQLPDLNGSEHATDASLVDQAYGKILTLLSKRGAITSERLNITRLAETLDISRTPVSMALMRLEGEGLVQRTEDQTWVTTRLSLDDLRDIFDIKELLDPFVAREAAERITPESAQALLASAADMLDAAESGDEDRWIASDRRYHAILLRVAGNEQLERILRDFSRKLHQLKTIKSVIKRRMLVASSYHQDLAQAVAVGDGEAAAERALTDVRNLREAVMDVMENVLLPFLGERFSS